MNMLGTRTEGRDPDLPDFEKPPVVETLLSVQFEKLTAMQTMHLGLFGREMQDSFPKAKEDFPIPPVIEQFSEGSPQGVRVQFQAMEAPSLPRLLLFNTAGTELIQIQNDRFIKNWRQPDEQHKYPHYDPVIKPAFERDFQKFQDFLTQEKLGPLKINQCEVTYVNHIVSGISWQELGNIGKIFAFWNELAAPLARPENFDIRVRFPITDENDQRVGRLHVEVQPALRATDGRPMYVVNLTARGQLGSGFEFFDVGRRWIVQAFEKLTTQNMHLVWEKK